MPARAYRQASNKVEQISEDRERIKAQLDQAQSERNRIR